MDKLFFALFPELLLRTMLRWRYRATNGTCTTGCLLGMTTKISMPRRSSGKTVAC